MQVSETMKTAFWHFQIYLKMLNLLTKIVKQGEGSIGFIFYQVY
jgi:hypothetical protein